MHFTRDPIVETILTPKEGHKLSIRSSNGAKSDEYLVDAVEVITFGHVYFLRSLERPKAFLLPLSDYEIIEVREMKIPLQATSYEKAIKIPSKSSAKKEEKKAAKKSQKPNASQNAPQKEEKKSEEKPAQVATDKKEVKKKGRRSKKKKEESKQEKVEEKVEAKATEKKEPEKKLVPPPATLISETINRYKTILLPEEEVSTEEESS